jgi:hypothetical protein
MDTTKGGAPLSLAGRQLARDPAMLLNELNRQELHSHEPRPYTAGGRRAARVSTRVPQGLASVEAKGLEPSARETADVFPTSGGHNPTLTIMALALRNARQWA